MDEGGMVNGYSTHGRDVTFIQNFNTET